MSLRHFLQWWESNSHRKIAVFGAGSDFQAICVAIPEFRKKVRCVIDEGGAPGTVSLSDALKLEPDIVIPASLVHQETMRRKLVVAGYRGEIRFLYENDAELGALGLLAHDSGRDWPFSHKSSESGQGRAFRIPDGPLPVRRILLVHPPFDVANHRHKKTMPLGLLYLGAAVRKAFPGIEIRLIDAHIERLGWSAMQARLDREEYDLVLLSYWSAQAGNATLIAEHVRSIRPEAIVVHGGVHATLRPEVALSAGDVVIPHEGERALVRFIRDLSEGCAGSSGSSYWIGQEARRDFSPAFVEDLDDLPFPAWELLPDPVLYDHPLHVVGGRRFPILGSRGCPFSCTFCSSPLFWKRRVRWRSPANVVDEMDAVAERYGVGQFHFWDDNMVMNREWIEGLIRELADRGREYRWVGLSRASDIVRQHDVLERMRDAGCVGIEIGVESFADQVSKALAKGEHTESTRAAVRCLHDAGIVPLYTHMLFTPGETIRSYREKEEFLSELNRSVGTAVRSDSPLGQLTTPHVETEFARDAANFGLVLWRSPRDSYHHRVNFLPNSLLDDVPVLSPGAERPDSLCTLGTIIQSVYDWDIGRMRRFLVAHDRIWGRTDGGRSVRGIAESVSAEGETDFEEACMFACLSVALWARSGAICGS